MDCDQFHAKTTKTVSTENEKKKESIVRAH